MARLAAGLDAERVSRHKTHVRGTQSLMANNCSAAEIMRQSQWKSGRMIFRYSERLHAGLSTMRRAAKSLLLQRKRKLRTRIDPLAARRSAGVNCPMSPTIMKANNGAGVLERQRDFSATWRST